MDEYTFRHLYRVGRANMLRIVYENQNVIQAAFFDVQTGALASHGVCKASAPSNIGLASECLSSGPTPPQTSLARGSLAPLLLPMHIPFATPRSTFENSDAALATYKRRQIKHLKQAFEILAKTPKKHLKTIAKITQHRYETPATYE
jgi:hypothetical protein